MKKVAILALMISLALTAGLSGASQETKPPLRQAIVKLNYVRPNDVLMLLQPFTSREGRIMSSQNQNILSLSDYPENVDKMLAVIKDIDVKPPDVLLTIQLVLASEEGTQKIDEALANDPVIKELRGFLKYKSFSHLDTSLVRALSDYNSELTMGPKGEFVLNLRTRVTKKDQMDIIQVEVRLNQLSGAYKTTETRQKENEKIITDQVRESSQTLIESNFTIRSGDKAVVGISRTAGGEKGLILIISAKIV